MNKNLLIGAIVSIVIIGGGWWFYTQAPDRAGASVKIGAMFSQVGYGAFAGEAALGGFLMAIEDSGMDIDYVAEDIKSETKTAVTVAKKLVEIDKVIAVIGPEWAEFGEVVSPIANQTKTVFISPWMVSEDKLNPPYYFTATPSDRTKQRRLIEYMADHGVKNLVLTYSNNAWSLAGMNVFKDELAKNGRIQIAGEFKFQAEQTDYRTEIVKLKALKPNAIYSLVATDESQGIFAKQLQEAGAMVQMYIDVSRAESPVSRERFLPYIVGSIYPATKEYKNAKAFNEKFEKRWGHPPGALSAATAYDMTTLVSKAIKSGARTSDEIKDYLLGVKNYEGYSNTITFNKDGQVAEEEMVIKRVTQTGSEVIE